MKKHSRWLLVSISGFCLTSCFEVSIDKVDELEADITELKKSTSLRPCFVQMDRVFDSSEGKQEAQAQLVELTSVMNAELQVQRDLLREKELKIQELRGVTTEEEDKQTKKSDDKSEAGEEDLATLEAEYAELLTQIQEQGTRAQQQINIAKENTRLRLYKNCATVATFVAKEEGYDYVINASITAQGGLPVIVGRMNQEDDITDLVIERLKEKEAKAVPEK